MTRLLRALDAALTAFVNELYPFPILNPMDDFDEASAAEYLRADCGLGAVGEPLLTDTELNDIRFLLRQYFESHASADELARIAPRPAAESTPPVAAVPPRGDGGRSPLDRF